MKDHKFVAIALPGNPQTPQEWQAGVKEVTRHFMFPIVLIGPIGCQPFVILHDVETEIYGPVAFLDFDERETDHWAIGLSKWV